MVYGNLGVTVKISLSSFRINRLRFIYGLVPMVYDIPGRLYQGERSKFIYKNKIVQSYFLRLLKLKNKKYKTLFS